MKMKTFILLAVSGTHKIIKKVCLNQQMGRIIFLLYMCVITAEIMQHLWYSFASALYRGTVLL